MEHGLFDTVASSSNISNSINSQQHPSDMHPIPININRIAFVFPSLPFQEQQATTSCPPFPSFFPSFLGCCCCSSYSFSPLSLPFPSVPPCESGGWVQRISFLVLRGSCCLLLVTFCCVSSDGGGRCPSS